MQTKKLIFKWISRKIFKQEECCVFNKPTEILYALMFPIHWLVHRNTHLRYDPFRESYLIEGLWISGNDLHVLKNTKGLLLKPVMVEGNRLKFELKDESFDCIEKGRRVISSDGSVIGIIV